MTQRDYMRTLYQRHRCSEADIVRAYADGERNGIVHRNQNKYNLTPESYAKALYKDGTKKGWIDLREGGN